MQNRKFLEKLDIVYESINKAKDNYTQELEKFIIPFKENIEIFVSIWEEKSEEFEEKLQRIGTDLNYKFGVASNDKMAFHNLKDDLVNLFPINNADGQYINFDEFYSINPEWIIESLSDDNFIHITFNPLEEDPRYPIDPEDNILYFEYRLPLTLHEDSFCLSIETKKEIFTQYIEENVEKFLDELKNKILVKQKVVDKQLSEIDFNDPEVIKELRNRIK